MGCKQGNPQEELLQRMNESVYTLVIGEVSNLLVLLRRNRAWETQWHEVTVAPALLQVIYTYIHVHNKPL